MLLLKRSSKTKGCSNLEDKIVDQKRCMELMFKEILVEEDLISYHAEVAKKTQDSGSNLRCYSYGKIAHT